MESPAVIQLGKIVAIILAAIAGAAVANATDCHPAQFVQKSAVIQYAAPIVTPAYQAQTLYLVGAPYRAHVLASKAEATAEAAADARLLRRFQAFLQAEATMKAEAKATGGILSDRCVKCHAADSPGGGIVLDGSEPLTAEQKNAVMGSVLSGRMPKDLKPLDAQERDELAKLLFLGDW